MDAIRLTINYDKEKFLRDTKLLFGLETGKYNDCDSCEIISSDEINSSDDETISSDESIKKIILNNDTSDHINSEIVLFNDCDDEIDESDDEIDESESDDDDMKKNIPNNGTSDHINSEIVLFNDCDDDEIGESESDDDEIDSSDDDKSNETILSSNENCEFIDEKNAFASLNPDTDNNIYITLSILDKKLKINKSEILIYINK